MAIAFDAKSQAGPFTSGATQSVTQTCTGSNLILIAGVTYTGSISAATYNSVAMTLLAARTINGQNYAMYYLVNPSTGSNNLSFTSSGVVLGLVGASYTGAKQTGQPDSTNNSQTAGSSATVTDTIINTNCWLIGIGGAQGTGFSTFSSGDTERTQVVDAPNDWGLDISDKNGVVSVGSNSLSWSANSAGATGGIVMGLLATDSALPANGNMLLVM